MPLSVIQQIIAEYAMTNLADLLREARHLGVAGGGLSHACQPTRNIRTLTRLAREVGVDRRRMCEAWAEANVPHGMRLVDGLAAINLIHAATYYSQHGTWHPAARSLGVAQVTLRRMSSRLVGMTLAEIGSDRDAFTSKLSARFECMIVGGTPKDS